MRLTFIGASESVTAHEPAIKLFGEYARVRANVKAISSLSAHADYGEPLQWLSS